MIEFPSIVCISCDRRFAPMSSDQQERGLCDGCYQEYKRRPAVENKYQRKLFA